MPKSLIRFMKGLFMEKKVKLSIVIVNFNTHVFIDKCLKSISESNLSGKEFEVVVIDNASKEELKIKSRLSGIPQKAGNYGFGIKLIKNKKNVGFAAANNQGIKIAIGEYVLLLNPDTIIPKNTLSFMINFMEKNPKVGVATCKVVLDSKELDDACHRGFPTPWNAFFQFCGLSGFFPKSKLLNGYHLGFCELDNIHEIDACAGAFMMVRKSAGETVKWLDEDYFWYGEDLDFCYRIKQTGWQIMYVPDVQITHHKGVSAGIKKHSQHLTTADHETKLLATRARFEVMRIFYEKHYKDKYPVWLTNIVFTGIKLKEYLNILKYK